MKDTPEKEYLFLSPAAAIIAAFVFLSGVILRWHILRWHILRAPVLHGAGGRGFPGRSGRGWIVYALRHTLPHRVKALEKPFKLTAIQILTAFPCTYCVSFYAHYCKEVKFVR